MKSLIKFFLLTIFFLLFLSCNQQHREENYRIGFSQAMTTDNWRREMNKSMQLEASLHPEIVLEIKDAENSVAQQLKQIEGFIKDDVDVLIVSPIQSNP
ncbi:MAG TPA: AraC family transcriptional regulator, partial [Zunongwangia profunda]|nr:AraC family transcriptional regulator [Zunongwangia profunda]